ncbi:MAG: MFS transporter [Desulfobacterales bacterium]|nr:MFS transporter [Desulfobacterales bacterium]
MRSVAPDYRLDPRRWTVFAVISLVYFFVYFHRVSTSVIVSDLLAAFDTNATALGVMSSMYFYLYAIEQPAVGYLTDRLGPRRVIGWWSVAAAAGCFLFAMAPTIGWASAGRALIGLGVGGVYVPAIKAISQRFRKSEFSTMLGLLMSVGNIGAVIATTPLAWMAVTWGWRPTFALIGAATLVLAAATFWLARDPQTSRSSSDALPASGADGCPRSASGAMTVLTSAQFWTIGAIFFGIYGTLVTLQGLWATPFLMAAFGIERILASKINMLIPLGVIIGAPAFGWLGDRFSRNKARILTAIIVIYSTTWAAMIWFFQWLGIPGTAAVFFVMGVVTGGFISILWGIVRETTPSRILGLTSGLLNVAPFLGVAAFQVITGAILGRNGRVGQAYAQAGYHQAFLACLAGIVLCLILSLFLDRQVRQTHAVSSTR